MIQSLTWNDWRQSRETKICIIFPLTVIRAEYLSSDFYLKEDSEIFGWTYWRRKTSSAETKNQWNYLLWFTRQFHVRLEDISRGTVAGSPLERQDIIDAVQQFRFLTHYTLPKMLIDDHHVPGTECWIT
jgi:hypothetical protein